MQLRWTAPAIEEFESQIQYIFEDDPVAARETADSVLLGLDRLLAFPGLGRKGKRRNTRELVIPPFVIVYKVWDETVEVLHVRHGAQDWNRF